MDMERRIAIDQTLASLREILMAAGDAGTDGDLVLSVRAGLPTLHQANDAPGLVPHMSVVTAILASRSERILTTMCRQGAVKWTKVGVLDSEAGWDDRARPHATTVVVR